MEQSSGSLFAAQIEAVMGGNSSEKVTVGPVEISVPLKIFHS
jgi:hypothetical protein